MPTPAPSPNRSPKSSDRSRSNSCSSSENTPSSSGFNPLPNGENEKDLHESHGPNNEFGIFNYFNTFEEPAEHIADVINKLLGISLSPSEIQVSKALNSTCVPNVMLKEFSVSNENNAMALREALEDETSYARKTKAANQKMYTKNKVYQYLQIIKMDPIQVFTTGFFYLMSNEVHKTSTNNCYPTPTALMIDKPKKCGQERIEMQNVFTDDYKREVQNVYAEMSKAGKKKLSDVARTYKNKKNWLCGSSEEQ